MGVMWHSADYLCNASKNGLDFTKTLTIGRSYFQVYGTNFQHMLRHHGLPGLPDRPGLDVPMPQYAEFFFKHLGAQSVESLDASGYEGADYITDLNDPIPDHLHGRFDLVYDGGSLEHIFNTPQALKNYMSLTREGGSVVIETMANNTMGHGFYQFSPEIFFRALSPENGFSIVNVMMFEYFDYSAMYKVSDPSEVKSRIELANPSVRIGVIAHARRDRILPIFAKWPQQSDYSAVWKGEQDITAYSTTPAQAGLKRRVIDRLKRSFPQAVYLKYDLIRKFPAFHRWLNRRRIVKQMSREFSFEGQPKKYEPVTY